MNSWLWFDRLGMRPWIEGMASGMRRRVRLVDQAGLEVAAAGSGEGELWRHELEVNGKTVGWIEVCPPPSHPAMKGQLQLAVETFRALAEARNCVTDLVRTTAEQWRELSVLYRSSELLRGGAAANEVARHLLRHATGAIRDTVGVVRYRLDENGLDGDARTEGSTHLDAVVEWALSLDEGVLVEGDAELYRLGYRGVAPQCSLLAVPLKCSDRTYGALALARATKQMLRAEDLKLGVLLAGQAGQAFANLELVERVRRHERLQQELEVAAQIQESILPPRRISTRWLDVYGVCQPAAWVGGDAFFVHQLDSGEILAGVADVSGHGVSSALLMNAFASHLEALAPANDSPGYLLTAANNLISARVGAMGMFVTAALMRISPSGRLLAAHAGHPPVLLVSADGEIEEIGGGGLPLGILEEEQYEEAEVQLAPGGLVVSYTDGLTEAANAGGQLYGVERATRALSQSLDRHGDVEMLAGSMLADLEQFTGGRALNDDLTLLALRRTA